MLVAEPAGRGEDVGGVEVEAGVVGSVLVELNAVLERRNGVFSILFVSSGMKLKG